MSSTSTFHSWAIVEIMGHRQFAGLVTEQVIGGASFIRLDVPETKERPAFTKLWGAASIYGITPCDEQTARAFVEQLQQRAFSLYEAPRIGQSDCHDY